DRAGDQRRADRAGQRNLRAQVQRCNHLLAAPRQQEDHCRNRPNYARLFEAVRCARRYFPMRRKAEHSTGPGVDVDLRPDQRDGGYVVTAGEKERLQRAMWDAEGHRTTETIARPAARIAEIAGFPVPDGTRFIIVPEEQIGKEYPFSSEKLSPVLAIFRYAS